MVCLVSYSLFSMFYGKVSAQEQKDTPTVNPNSISMDSIDALLTGAIISNNYNIERNQVYRARAYGTQYPMNRYPLLVLDGNIMYYDSFDLQYLDSLISGQLPMEKENIARLFGIKESEIKRMKILKDEAATSEWGSRALHGVIEVVTKRGAILMRKDADDNRYAWESINEEIRKEYSKTEQNSLPGNGLYIPSDHATYYSIEEFYNNWIMK